MTGPTATDTTAAPPVLVERQGHVTVITLNRPRALNAVNGVLAHALGEALASFDAADDERVAVITGTGRAFCVGMDLKAFTAGESAESAEHPEWGFGGFAKHVIGKPVIAAVNGFAFGGGAELMLACDLAVCDTDATFGFPEVTRGLFAGAGGLIRLSQQVAQRRALELILTGNSIDATTALGWGLVNRIAPSGEALSLALTIAQRIAQNAPLAVAASKRIFFATRHGDPADSGTWMENDRELESIFTSLDAKEGSLAFAQKREANWVGR